MTHPIKSILLTNTASVIGIFLITITIFLLASVSYVITQVATNKLK